MRIILILLSLCLLAGCASPTVEDEPSPALTAAVTATAALAPEPVTVFDPSEYLLGFIVDTGSFEGKIAAHGFLRNAESAGYPSKIYPTNAVDAAIADGCKAVLLSGSVQAVDLERFKSAGCKTVAHGFDTDADVSVFSDVADYSAEVARAMGEELIARNLHGNVLVVGDASSEAARAFLASFGQNYPQFPARVQSMPLSAMERAEAVKNLAGVYLLAPTGAKEWIEARDEAVKELTPSATPKPSPTRTPSPTPKPSPTPTPDPEASPAVSPTPTLGPTLAPHQAVKSLVLIATDYTQENLSLLQSGGVFAIVARPYFDAAAQGMLLLDRLLRGVQVPEALRLNVPVIKKASMDKDQSIVTEALEWTE